MKNSIYSSHIIQVTLIAASIVPFHVPASAATYTVLHHFGGTTNNGSHPQGTLVMDRLGNIYGTTAHGGQNNRGTIFRYDPTAVSPTTAVAAIHSGAIYVAHAIGD